MENYCSICSKKLKFIGMSTSGAGQFKDGGFICLSCYNKVYDINYKIAVRIEDYLLGDIMELLQGTLNIEAQKKSRLDEIKNQIQKLKLTNISTFLGRREIKELPNILAPTEVIDNIVQGIYNSGQGILISTNRRLVFVDKGILYGLKVEDFPLDKISSIQYETGMLFGKIKIHTTGNVAKIEQVEKKFARDFAEFVRDKLSQQKETINTTTVSEPNVLDQLEKLAKFKENGIVSEEEFNELKQKLLSKL